jgi:hypothetical protein
VQAKAGIFFAYEAPAAGGQTGFADMRDVVLAVGVKVSLTALSLAILHTKYTEWRQNDLNVCA